MLNEYLPEELMYEETVRRNYLLRNIEKDDTWLGGKLIVPFQGASASSISFGSLTASDDVAEDEFVRGSVDDQKEVWGTMKFNHRDLMEHGKLSEQNFLKILPDTVEKFVDNFKDAFSVHILNGAHFAKLIPDPATGLVVAGDASGVIYVDHPNRFTLGQKVSVDDGDSSPATGYVRSIDMNLSKVVLYDARTGGSAVNLSGYAVANDARVYHPGAQANPFSNLRESLLSAANGGTSTLYGKTKTAYPYLQAANMDGQEMTSANILNIIFEASVDFAKRGKGKPTEVLMSLTNFGYCMAAIEANKGAFNVVPNSAKSSVFGWFEIEVGMVTKTPIKLVGIQEADEDVMMFIDWRAFKLYTNGGFQKRRSPEGKEFYEVRATTGYYYLVDICLFGEFVLQRPSYCGIIYNIDIAAAEGEA